MATGAATDVTSCRCVGLWVIAALMATASAQQCGTTWRFNPSDSRTSIQITWAMVNAESRLFTVKISRYVAYSSIAKYTSLAFSSQNRMGPTELVVDCYESAPFDPRIGSSRNTANHTNIVDAVLDSRIHNGTANRTVNLLTCSFNVELPRNTTYALAVSGQVWNGTKQHHSEWFTSVPLTFTCADPGNVAVAQQMVDTSSSIRVEAASRVFVLASAVMALGVLRGA